MVVSVWRLVKHICFNIVYWRRCICLAYAWCHFSASSAHSPFTPHRVMVGSCIYFYLSNPCYWDCIRSRLGEYKSIVELFSCLLSMFSVVCRCSSALIASCLWQILFLIGKITRAKQS
jgi:hypothetical protein